MRLENKTALITGASRNIGAEIARTFAREGADLILNTRQSAQELETVAAECRELGVRTHTVIGDVADPDRVSEMVAEGIDALGKVDVLVSNVAVRPHKPIMEVSVDEWQATLATNLHAAFYLIKAVLPGMMERGAGSIIAMGGQSAITGRPDTAVVTTAKTGLLGLIRAVAAECAQYGVRANMVNPGATDTSRAHPEWYPEFQEVPRGSDEHLKGIPLGRQGTVYDIANACLFYASDESSYITGDRMNVVGGRYIV
jgi:3-oxoacyl-[acyl-carrier protein] reductase